jgi:uncharacterized protein YxjI
MPASARPTTTTTLSAALDEAPRLVVRQARDWVELIAWEVPNRYALLTERGALAGWALERAGGGGATLLRWMLKANRPFRMEVVPADGAREAVLHVDRPFTWFLARLTLLGGEGRPLGTVRQRLSLLRKRFDVEAPDGRLLARVTGPLLHPWTFVFSAPNDDRELGRIEKRWSGAANELFTDADTFLVTFGRADPTLRRLMLAAAVLIDFRYFEDTG